MYSGYAWDSITFDRGKNGWRDDLWCSVTKFFDKFENHELLRKIDTTSLKIPIVDVKKFVTHFFKFEYVETLILNDCSQIISEFRSASLVK